VLNPDLVDWAGFQALVGRSNNVAWRNFDVVPTPDPGGARAWGEFLIRGVPEVDVAFDIEIEMNGIPENAGVQWRVPRPLHRLLQCRVGGARPLVLVAKDPDSVTVALDAEGHRFRSVRLPRDARFRTGLSASGAGGRVTFIQRHEGVEVGRVTWSLDPREVG
jgi:hypothetical protein